MAHMIEANDNMFSVNEVPWHGLGNVLTDYPTIKEAIVASGLDWTASLEKMIVPMTIEGVKVNIEVKDQFAIMRNDIHHVLGVVGNRYQIYQNSDMWKFIEDLQSQTNMKIETAGSLRNGQVTWVLAKHDTIEAINGDPIEEYFLFRNGFNGLQVISTLFTNIRVVCNNTLTAAMNQAKNIFSVRHTKNADEQLRQVQQALGVRLTYRKEFKQNITILANHQMNATETNSFIDSIVFPHKVKEEQTVGENGIVVQLEEFSERSETIRQNKIEEVTALIEEGAGTDIKGVRGTAYGLYNAVAEWADHHKPVRVTGERDEREAKFENAFFGAGSKIKENTFNELLKVAA